MSGHSKWSTIKHKKAIIDAKRSGVFTKMAKAITVAVKKGGNVGDPDMNFSLRLAVDKARAVNMPKENIERAIEKGMGKGGGGEIEDIVLEGYGPHGVALVIETLTDNHNRTVAEVKNILEKAGGRLGEPGSVLYQFDIVGQVTCTGLLTDETELELIDMGMMDFESHEGETRILCRKEAIKSIADYLSHHGMSDVVGSIVYHPSMTTDMTSHADEIDHLLEAIEDNEDVQEVYTNALW
jgi:YebC/PmpR family DNA-binding regulatory protein